MTPSQTVEDRSIPVNKAVLLYSGIAGQSFTLTNIDLSTVVVTFPDAVSVLAPSDWDGMIAPPQTVSVSGVAPSGFSLGSSAIEVGSSVDILLFDKPVALVLSGVTGSVGYKPPGSSSWTQITNTCGGSYASPSAPSFPGECFISNDSDTKIYTYHFTTFALLDNGQGNSNGNTRSYGGRLFPSNVPGLVGFEGLITNSFLNNNLLFPNLNQSKNINSNKKELSALNINNVSNLNNKIPGKPALFDITTFFQTNDKNFLILFLIFAAIILGVIIDILFIKVRRYLYKLRIKHDQDFKN